MFANLSSVNFISITTELYTMIGIGAHMDPLVYRRRLQLTCARAPYIFHHPKPAGQALKRGPQIIRQ